MRIKIEQEHEYDVIIADDIYDQTITMAQYGENIAFDYDTIPMVIASLKDLYNLKFPHKPIE